MRYFVLTAIGSFAIMSATALCAAQVAVHTGAAGFSGVRIELARGAQSHDRRGKANDGRTGAAASEQVLARGAERNGHRSKGHDAEKSGAAATSEQLACGKEAADDHGQHKHGAATSEQMIA